MKPGAFLPLCCGIGLTVLFAASGLVSTRAAEAHQTTLPADRLEWNQMTLVENYLQQGHRSPAWDEPATNALAAFAVRRSLDSEDAISEALVIAHCRAAALKGCADPVILYLHARYVLGPKDGRADKAVADEYANAAGGLRQYPCAPIRQFYIALGAAEAIKSSSTGKTQPPEVNKFRHAALSKLMEALQDPGIPSIEAYQASRALLDAVDKNPRQYADFFHLLEPVLMKNWPNEGRVHLFSGVYHIEQAWRARGNGFADGVTEDGWKQFGEHLKQAGEALEKGWKMDPAIAEIPWRMMRVELGLSRDRKRMEIWFNRAMNLDSNYVEACRTKLVYLDPKWHGSVKDMQDFSRECATSQKWGGEVLLMPVHAHDALAARARQDGDTNYWKLPAVWQELKPTFERYLSRYPEASKWRQNSAKYAYRCEQWGEFNRQLSLFNGRTNYSYFGGKEAFDLMVQNSRERARSSK